MKQIIYAKSPNGKRVPIGIFDPWERIAIFDITPERFFQGAEACGIDDATMKKKEMNFCDKIIFNFWDGKSYWITMEDFRKNSWLYPPKPKDRYKAGPRVFKPKWMISRGMLERISRKTKETEMLKMAIR